MSTRLIIISSIRFSTVFRTLICVVATALVVADQNKALGQSHGQIPDPGAAQNARILDAANKGLFRDLLNAEQIEISAVPNPVTSPSNPADSSSTRHQEKTVGHLTQTPSQTGHGKSTAKMVLPSSARVQANASQNYAGARAGYNQPLNGTALKSEIQTANSGLRPNTTELNTPTYRLEHNSVARFEQVLQEAYASRLSSSLSSDQRYLQFTLPTLTGNPIEMQLDRQTGVLTYGGDIRLQASWYQLMQQLDSSSVRLADGTTSHAAFLFPGDTDYETVRQTAYELGMLQDQEPVLPGNQQNPQLPGLDEQLKGDVEVIQDPNTGMMQFTYEFEEDRAVLERYFARLKTALEGKQKKAQTFPLKNVQAATIEERVKELYDAAYQTTLGTIEVKSNPLNNSLIVVGLPDALKQVESIIAQFDTPGDPSAVENFKSFRLKFLSAGDAKTRLDLFFVQSTQGGGAGGDERLPSVPVVTIPDFRSNIIVVKGSAQSIKEAEMLLAAIDIDKADSEHEIKVIKITNRLAAELAIIVQDALNGQQFGAGNGYKGAEQQGAQQQDQQQQQQVDPRRSALSSKSLMMQGENGNEGPVSSGIMFDVRVTADESSNSLIISAPPRSMPLIEKLITELDRTPDVEVQMKVFHIVNGDAIELLNTLNSLFGGNQQQQQQDFGQQNSGQQGNLFNQLPLQTAGSTPGSNLVNLRFSADPRTNTIIGTGPVGELQVVEALLNRLDANQANNLVTKVYRLSNAPALDIADTISQWITGRDDINSIDPKATGNLNQTIRRVIVVPEVVSNSLLIQAHPDYIDEVLDAIRAIDRRPPMVKVKVLLAEVDLNRLEEFGMDLGIQDSILFDRGTTIGAGNAITGIGFPFNTSGTGNANAFARENVAGQALSNMGAGRINTELGYGGFVLSAGNESLSFLLRALENKRCVRVLSKPTITTLENLQGRVNVGANVPRIAGTTVNGLNVTQNIEFRDVGVILEVVPRVSPDGMIVLTVNASRSSVGPEATGITVGVGADGTPIRSPQILQNTASTTLMSRSGQTVVFGGLIQEAKSHEERGVPILSGLPVVGPLFKFESDRAGRTELMIIMTPYLITDDNDIDHQNQEEMDRMHWCLEDVAEMYGSTGHKTYEGNENAVETIYPDNNVTGEPTNN